MREEGLVNYTKSAMSYAVLAIIPAALGYLAAHGGYLGGVPLLFAMLFAAPSFIYSFLLSLYCLCRKAFKTAMWYFAMAFVGIGFAIAPIFLAKYVFMTR